MICLRIIPGVLEAVYKYHIWIIPCIFYHCLPNTAFPFCHSLSITHLVHQLPEIVKRCILLLTKVSQSAPENKSTLNSFLFPSCLILSKQGK